MDRKERTIFVTIVINLLLAGFKSWLARSSGSLALQASAVHSVTDLVIGVLVLAGLLISRWDASRKQVQDSANRAENWIALLVSLAIFYVGFDIVREVLLGEPPELRNLLPITIASLVTVAAAYFIARYKLYVGRETNSPALIASGYHSQLDIYAAIVVVVGLAGSALGLPNLDRVAAAVVVVFIFLSGYEIASAAIVALRKGQALDIEGEHDAIHPPATGPRMRRAVAPIAVVILLAFYLFSGFYSVSPGEAAVVRRFGGVVANNVGPGLHYRLPWPVDRVDVVEVDTIRRTDNPATLMVTGDENLISVRLSLHYAVSDAARFLLGTTDPATLVAQAGESAMRQVVAQETVDALLTVDKDLIERRAAELAQITLDKYNAGLRVAGVQLLESNPPPEVADAFRDVSSASEDRNTFINEALAYQNEVIPLARGDAARITQEANAYYATKTGRAAAEAALFTSRQGAYAEVPDATRIRLYLEAVESVLPGVRKFILDDAVQMETTDLWIPGNGGVQTFQPVPEGE